TRAATHARDQRLQALVHLGDAGDLAELRHLGDHLRIVDRVERDLGGELGGHQPQEVALVHRARRLGGSRHDGRAGRGAGDRRHWPSLKVSRVRDLAVCRTCTLFWYWRAVSTISTSSAALSTPASQTSPFW